MTYVCRTVRTVSATTCGSCSGVDFIVDLFPCRHSHRVLYNIETERKLYPLTSLLFIH